MKITADPFAFLKAGKFDEAELKARFQQITADKREIKKMLLKVLIQNVNYTKGIDGFGYNFYDSEGNKIGFIVADNIKNLIKELEKVKL